MTNSYDDMSEREFQQYMYDSARDWEIIRNNFSGTNDRVWTTDEDYTKEQA